MSALDPVDPVVPAPAAWHHRGMTAPVPDSARLIAAGAAELLAQNPIQPGRVTPHKAFDGTGVRIRHIAMDANTVLTEHSVPRPILVSVVAGRVRFSIGEVTHTLVAGGIIHVDASVRHDVAADEPSHLLICLLG